MAANIITFGMKRKLQACDTEEPQSKSKNGKLNNLTGVYGLDCKSLRFESFSLQLLDKKNLKTIQGLKKT